MHLIMILNIHLFIQLIRKFYHIIKNNKIEYDFPSTRCTMIIDFILSFFMLEFVRRYNFIGLCSHPGWTILRISGPTLNQH